MANDAVKCCNLTIALIGSDASIQSLDEESTEAQYCKLFYEQAIDELLEKYDWHFARDYAVLPLVSSDNYTRTGKWSHSFSLPPELLKERFIIGGTPENPIPFEQGINATGNGKVLYCNQEAVSLAFTTNKGRNPILWPATFMIMAAHYLAIYVAKPITQKDNADKLMLDKFNIKINDALVSDFYSARGTTTQPESSWIKGRS